MSTCIIGDEIHYAGYRVAILTLDAGPTVLNEFEWGVNNGTLFENEPDHPKSRDEQLDSARVESSLQAWDIIKKASRGGLVKLEDAKLLFKAHGIDVDEA